MSGIYLPRLFPPHIVERGLLYLKQGKVRDVCKTSSGRYRAEQAVAYIKPRTCLRAHTLPAISQNQSVGCVRYARTRSF